MYDVNGVPHSVLTKQPITRNATTGQPNKVYKLAGNNVYDIDGKPHYASTNKPIIRDDAGKPRNVYKLGGQEVYDVDNKPVYADTGKPLQHNSQGAPQSQPSRGRVETKMTNANGVEQKGTQMAPSTLGDFNDMYARVVGKHNMSATAYNPFESVHLHTKGDSRGDMMHDGPSSYSADEAAAFNSGQGIEWSSDQKADAPYTIPKPADVTSTEGAPQIVKSGAQKVVKGVNGHEFGGDHEAPATMKRDRTSELRRKWMLGDMKDEKGNDLSNIQRLRGMRMEQGFDQQGDKFYAMGSLDPANKSKPTEISKDQYRQAVVSDAGAQQVATDLKDAYTSRIKNEGNKETTAPILPTQADMESYGTSVAEHILKNKKPIQK